MPYIDWLDIVSKQPDEKVLHRLNRRAVLLLLAVYDILDYPGTYDVDSGTFDEIQSVVADMVESLYLPVEEPAMRYCSAAFNQGASIFNTIEPVALDVSYGRGLEDVMPNGTNAMTALFSGSHRLSHSFVIPWQSSPYRVWLSWYVNGQRRMNYYQTSTGEVHDQFSGDMYIDLSEGDTIEPRALIQQTTLTSVNPSPYIWNGHFTIGWVE